MIPDRHSYQIRATQFQQEHKYSYIAADMGLGKTRISIDWANSLDTQILVVAPLRAVLLTWPDEIEKWSPGTSYFVMQGPDRHLARNAKFLIIGFHNLKWLFTELKKLYSAKKKMPFGAMIVDEGQWVKSHKTKRYEMLRQIGTLCIQGITVLSGTPAPNALMDLWTQYFILDGGKRLGKNITTFRRTYFDQSPYCIHVFTVKPEAPPIIHEVVSDITFRLDAKDHLEMPDIIYNEIPVVLPPNAQKHANELRKKLLTEIEEYTVTAKTAATLSVKLRQVIQGALYTDDKHSYEIIHSAKLDALKELVESVNGQGILCAINFRFEVDILKKAFPNAPFTVGGSDSSDFVRVVREWNAGKIPIWFCHPGSLSSSVNLQQGSHILVWYSLTWSAEHYLQLNARIYRQGQKHTVIIHHIVAKGTIDERIMEAVRLKILGQTNLLNFLRDKHGIE